MSVMVDTYMGKIVMQVVFTTYFGIPHLKGILLSMLGRCGCYAFFGERSI